MVRYLTEKEVVLLNRLLIERYSPGELKGVKDINLLKSALGRPRQSVLGQDAYETIWLKAAALFESLRKIILFIMLIKEQALLLLNNFFG